MIVSNDWERFDTLQRALLHEFIDSIYQNLTDAAVPSEQVQQLLAEISFDVCCAIDGSTLMHSDSGGARILPILTFAKHATLEELTSSGGGSWMHEYVHEAVAQYLKTKVGL